MSYSIKVADQWERVVMLRLGRFRDHEDPGLFFIIPIIEKLSDEWEWRKSTHWETLPAT